MGSRCCGSGMGWCGGNGKNNRSVMEFSDEKKVLETVDIDKLEYFSFKGKTIARICSVYDGDTFTAVFLHNGVPVKYRCRCAGYDAPEIHPSKTLPNREQLVQLAITAKNRLISLLGDYAVVEFLEFDKYGRILVKIETNTETGTKNISDIMIAEGLGKPYNGATKIKF